MGGAAGAEEKRHTRARGGRRSEDQDPYGGLGAAPGVLREVSGGVSRGVLPDEMFGPGVFRKNGAF